MASDREPSILEYARFHKLAFDHLAVSPLKDFKAPEDFLQALHDPPDLFSFENQATQTLHERLCLDAETTGYLASILTPPLPPLSPTSHIEARRKRRKDLYLELPLLMTDHEYDMQIFKQPLEPDLTNEFLPMEDINEEADEGFTWPQRFLDWPQKMWKRLETEKLELGEDGVKVIFDVVRPGNGDGSQLDQIIETEVLRRRKTVEIEKLSPPLMPMSPDIVPYEPSSETGHLDLLSDGTSPIAEEIKDMERTIFNRDMIKMDIAGLGSSSPCSEPLLLDTESLRNHYSPLKIFHDPPTSPPEARAERAKDLKLELPLVPPEPEEQPPWRRKSVIFKKALTELIPILPPPAHEPEETERKTPEDGISEILLPVALQAEQSIQHEQLSEAATTLRLPVPRLDFSMPVAPWNKATESNTRAAGSELREVFGETGKELLKAYKWPLDIKVEKELRWNPFLNMSGRFELHETIEDSGSAAEFVKQPECVDLDSLVWKQQGLRLFDDLQDSEDELEVGDFPPVDEIQLLVRKRKLDLDYQSDVPNPESSRPPSAINYNAPSNGPESSQHLSHAKRYDAVSVAEGLETFMNLRKGVLLLRRPSEKSESEDPAATITQSTTSKSRLESIECSPVQHSLWKPHFLIPNEKRQFIVSENLLHDRKVVRYIQNRWPLAELIARDFQPHANPFVSEDPMARERFSLTQIAVERTVEADIALSPSVGLILTTLSQITQRPLPGQPLRRNIREKVKKASCLYEKLIVLISQDKNVEEPSEVSVSSLELGKHDSEAIAQFMTFCSTLNEGSGVQIIFVHGGQVALAEWIVAMMVQYSCRDLPDRLVQEEKAGEIFLRRAGMNAFAAQAILARLKHTGEWENNAKNELARFIGMNPIQRFDMFESLLGGRKLLDRVCKAIDSRW